MKRVLRAAPICLVGIVIAGLAGAGGAVFAGHVTTAVKSYTGCVSTTGGVMTLVAEGDEPMRPCPSGSVPVHFSSGDITAVIAGAGLSGGGENGAVTLNLDAAHALPQSCASGQVPKANGFGGWTCGADYDTTYSPGTGLFLSGTQFNVYPSYRLPQTCGVGQTAKWSGSAWECADDNNTRAYWARSSGESLPLAFGTFQTAPNTVIASIELPAGAYALIASAWIINADDDDGTSAACAIPGDIIFTGAMDEDVGAGVMEALALTSVINHAGGPVRLMCIKHGGDNTRAHGSLSAIRVGGIG